MILYYFPISRNTVNMTVSEKIYSGVYACVCIIKQGDSDSGVIVCFGTKFKGDGNPNDYFVLYERH